MDFTALAFGFCAVLSTFRGQPTVSVGDLLDGECQIRVVYGDGQIDEIRDGHYIGVKIIDVGAEVIIDDQRFVIRKTLSV